ncbi:WhiB family transcriptional regulator [Streptomyces sp. NPDC060027]|uniref:WhiB family transcriptional regulator n=1 Tax=Streptomyces sp. NPDC060027 TaxID=3347040 RepID=UPI0036769783
MAAPRRTAGTIGGIKQFSTASHDWRARQAERGRLGRLSAAIEQNAACAEQNPELFFPKNADGEAFAKQICRGCPVVRECLMQALRLGDEYAVLGATTPAERAALTRRLAAKRQGVAV